jgi:hypothetical protein
MIGNIETVGANSYGVYHNNSIGNLVFIIGNITTERNWGHGIYNSSSDENNISMTGNIETEGKWGHGIYNSSSDENNISMTGNIETDGYGAKGIYNDSSNENNISMTGNIETEGNWGHGIYNSSSDENNISMTGNIETEGIRAIGIVFLNSTSNKVYVNGNIVTEGSDTAGILYGSDSVTNTATIKGKITAKDDAIIFGNSDASENQASYNVANISGVVSSENYTTHGIKIEAGSTNNTVNFSKGSRFIGAFVNDGDASNTLRFDMGDASSYMFSTQGNWNLVDTSKAVVFGSANSRSVADVEDTYNRIYQRFTQLDNDLAFQHRMDQDGRRQPYWVSGYRNQGERTTLNREIDTNHTGITFGCQLSDNWDLFVNAEKIEAEYGSSEHDLNTTSALVGLYSPHYGDVLNGSLSLKVVAGISTNEGELKVLNNAVALGEETVSDSYSTVTFLGGVDWLRAYSSHSQIQQYVHLGLNLLYESQPEYESSKYFVMHRNGTTQLNASAKYTIGFQSTDSRYNMNALVGLSYVNILSGEEHQYTITSLTNVATETSYTATKDELYYEGAFVLGYHVTDRTSIRLNVQMSAANEQDISGLSGSLSIQMES